MASTVVQSIEYGRVFGETVSKKVKFAVTAHTDGTVTSVTTDAGSGLHGKTITQEIMYWDLDEVIVDPGSTAPTASSDITLSDDYGNDLLGGNGTDLIHNTSTKSAPASTSSGQNKTRTVWSKLTLAVSNNSVNGATFDIYAVFKRMV